MALLSNWHTSGRRVGEANCSVTTSHRILPTPTAVSIDLRNWDAGKWASLTIDDVGEARMVRNAMDEFIQRREATARNS